jgi:hypothetical protein
VSGHNTQPRKIPSHFIRAFEAGTISAGKIAQELKKAGIKVSAMTVLNDLKCLGIDTGRWRAAVKKRQKELTKRQLALLKKGEPTLRGLAKELRCSLSGARWAYYRAIGRQRKETLGKPQQPVKPKRKQL